MTPEAQRIAIAEACGKLKRKDGETVLFQRPDEPGYVYQLVRSKHGSERPCYVGPFPDYLNDLNAMHEAIRDKIAGDKELEERFVEELHKLQCDWGDSEDLTPICTNEMCDILAECKWLAIVFLRTIGKWEE